MKNPVLDRLPKHLRKYIVDQKYEDYTPIDHAVWRYIMKQGFRFLSEHAHSSYVDGLKKTGINLERIPNIDEMNEILSRIGWGAVCVDGFIPPNAFMEFQAFNVLVIAADIRFIEHIEYTPAPDIVHEAAGHAPIIVNPEYAEYLRLFGEIGSKAISSAKDNELYEAIRTLSILKESPDSTEEMIRIAEDKVLEIQNNMGELSEMARIRNLHWWTVEYGLIGDMENPKIYGAGLLSSIGESVECMKPKVKKIPYSVETADFSFDITTQQPQLFVTPDFTHLTMVLNEFADTMALRKGGTESVFKAIKSEAYATVQLDSGIQISGIFDEVILDDNGEIAWFKTNSPSILCEHEQLLIGHGKEYHSHGYSSTIGKIKGFDRPLKSYRLKELKDLGYEAGKPATFEFQSGIKVEGIIHSFRKNRFAETLIVSLCNCMVSNGERVLFQPEWGIFDMAVGEKVVSVFAGSADKSELDTDSYISSMHTKKVSKHSEKLLSLYRQIRHYREAKLQDIKFLSDTFRVIKTEFSSDWLLSLEILELTDKSNSLFSEIHDYLLEKCKNSDINNLIINGLKLI